MPFGELLSRPVEREVEVERLVSGDLGMSRKIDLGDTKTFSVIPYRVWIEVTFTRKGFGEVSFVYLVKSGVIIYLLENNWIYYLSISVSGVEEEGR